MKYEAGRVSEPAPLLCMRRTAMVKRNILGAMAGKAVFRESDDIGGVR